ncbi:unnamed protein product [Ectocarpus sp. 8 AP-2014]
MGREGLGASTAIKWVLAENEAGPLRATEEAGGVLAGVPQGQPLNIVTIVGNARKGKSFLMNQLTGHDAMFRASAKTEPCTAGADLSSIVMSLTDFRRGSDSSSRASGLSPSEPAIVFVDMEGQGDKSTDHDVRLATPFLLVSKVVIYNWMSLPNKHRMLEELEVMVQAADKVSTQNNKGERDFGHLIILMRDVGGAEMSESDRAEEVRKLVLDNEQAGAGRTKLADRRAMDERNTIRDGLREGFASITIHAMPRPHPDCGDRVVAKAEIDSKFNASVDQLRDIIAGHLGTPHTFAGKKIAGGTHTHEIVDGLCAAVNSTEDVSPPSVLEAIYIRRAAQAVADALVTFDETLTSVFGDNLVLSTQDTKSAIEGARVYSFEEFDDATKGISDDIAQAQRTALEKQMSPKAEVVLRNQEEKRRELDNKLEAKVHEAKASISKKVGELDIPMEDAALVKKWDELVNSHFEDLERDTKKMVTLDDTIDEDLLAELKWSVSEAKFKELIEGTHEHVQELNRMAIEGKNNALAKEQAEEKAKEFEGKAEALSQDVAKANERAEQAREAAAQASEQAKRDAAAQIHQAQMTAAMQMQSAQQSSCMSEAQSMGTTRSRSGPAARKGRIRTFYKGGQFIPGGGHAPKGGGYYWKKV